MEVHEPQCKKQKLWSPYALYKDGEQGEYRDETKVTFALRASQAKGDYLTYEHDYSTRKEGKMAFEPQRQIAVGLGKDWDWHGTWSGLIHDGEKRQMAQAKARGKNQSKWRKCILRRDGQITEKCGLGLERGILSRSKGGLWMTCYQMEFDSIKWNLGVRPQLRQRGDVTRAGLQEGGAGSGKTREAG